MKHFDKGLFRVHNKHYRVRITSFDNQIFNSTILTLYTSFIINHGIERLLYGLLNGSKSNLNYSST